MRHWVYISTAQSIWSKLERNLWFWRKGSMLAGEVVTSPCNEVKVCSSELTYRVLPQGAHEHPKSIQRAFLSRRVVVPFGYFFLSCWHCRWCLILTSPPPSCLSNTKTGPMQLGINSFG